MLGPLKLAGWAPDILYPSLVLHLIPNLLFWICDYQQWQLFHATQESFIRHFKCTFKPKRSWYPSVARIELIDACPKPAKAKIWSPMYVDWHWTLEPWTCKEIVYVVTQICTKKVVWRASSSNHIGCAAGFRRLPIPVPAVINVLANFQHRRPLLLAYIGAVYVGFCTPLKLETQGMIWCIGMSLEFLVRE